MPRLFQTGLSRREGEVLEVTRSEMPVVPRKNGEAAEAGAKSCSPPHER